MIDFVKSSFHGEHKKDIDSYFLAEENTKKYNITQRLQLSTGEVYPPFTGKWYNFDIVSTRVRDTFMQNSLHAFYNSIKDAEAINYNDFTYSNLKYALGYIHQSIPLIGKTYLTELEFGLNVELPIDASNFINDNVLMYKNTPPTYSKSNKQMCIKKFTHDDFEIKIYDKGKKHKLNKTNLLRIEVKYNSSRVMRKFGISSLMSLGQKTVQESLFKDYINRIEDLVILDCIDCPLGHYHMTRGDKNLLFQYSNQAYWTNLKKTTKSTQNSHRKKQQQLINRYQLNFLHRMLLDILKEKFSYLLSN